MSVIAVSPVQFSIAPASQTVEVVRILRQAPQSISQLMEQIALQEATVSMARRNRDQWKHAAGGSHRITHRTAFERADRLYYKELETLQVLRNQRELVPA